MKVIVMLGIALDIGDSDPPGDPFEDRVVESWHSDLKSQVNAVLSTYDSASIESTKWIAREFLDGELSAPWEE